MEKNVLLTAKKGNEVVVIRPYTSIYNVKGLTELIQSTIDYVKSNYVHKEDGKGLSTNDFTDEDKARLINLATSNVSAIHINGTKVENDNGVVDLTQYTIIEDNALSDDEIEQLFKNQGE